MLNFWSKVLICTEDFNKASLNDIIDQLNYVKDLIGVEYIGMGADYDGVKDVPIGLEDVSTYPLLFAKLLEDPKWTVDDIKKIAGENILRVMRKAEDVRDAWKGCKASDETILFKDMALKETNCSCKTIKDHTKEMDEE